LAARTPAKRQLYRQALGQLTNEPWEPFLVRESGLPGPRANLELVQATADEGTLGQFRLWMHDEHEFLPLCGAVGLGRLIAAGQRELLVELRPYAADHRWRVREGVAMALQRLGAVDMHALLEVARTWADGSWLEQRAAVAGVCEPALLRDEASASAAVMLVDQVMESVAHARDRRDEGFKVLRQAMGYCWSVAIAAAPAEGKASFEKWLKSDDPDVEWIVRENLKKSRLKKMHNLFTNT